VYATTEPTEALLLGGKTATLYQGRVTQFGPTLEVYRRPVDLVTANAFSDPPLNTMAMEKTGGQAHLSAGATLSGSNLLALADGAYTIGLRPHHLRLTRTSAESAGLKGTVTLSEITGSESFIHVSVGGSNWVVLARGVQKFEPGSAIEVFVDPASLFVFDRSGALVAAPEFSAAA